MGTRADFYVGTGKDAEWLGSVAWDGYEWDEDKDSRIAKATTEEEYRAAVAEMLTGREDATMPDMGWPWPWNDSNTTDYAYAFHNGKAEAIDENFVEWPDMSARSNVTMGARSGVIFIQTR